MTKNDNKDFFAAKLNVSALKLPKKDKEFYFKWHEIYCGPILYWPNNKACSGCSRDFGIYCLEANNSGKCGDCFGTT